ncbi:LAMI_0C00144g1_1 [Lachancea mirantina]|uniref:2-dehydropantoate 2-reductase n=1 Tax=Lachancea mirantina TaxID=1230905 RepID=A0A1G4IZY2_9SACH|nr:LAMI_0C00144g1_1 [Lachancea mirantina]
MSHVPNVLIIGTGGVGSIVAYGIDYLNKSNLAIVVRRDYEKVKSQGYDVESVDYGTVKGWKPSKIFPSVEAASKGGVVFDFVVIATKNLPDIVKVEELADSVITPGKTVVVLVQNGFDLGRPFFAKYPENVILSSVTYIGSHNSQGAIHQTQSDKSFIGFFENPHLPKRIQEKKAKDYISIYKNDKNNCTYVPDTKTHRYRKLVYNATMNTVCAITGVDTGRVEFAGGLETLCIPAMKEVIAVAKADGVDLPADVINDTIHGDDGDWFEPSMLVDVKKGNPIELEVILGNLLLVAKELHVETPVLTMLYNLLKVIQFRLKEQQGTVVLPKDRPIYDKIYS